VPAGELVIGRSPDAAIRVDDDYTSPRHARVWQDEHGQAWIEDLGSTNGTWIRRPSGAVRVGGPTKIYPGDEIGIGRTSLPWKAGGGRLNREEAETLAVYNAERARGLVHTDEWHAKMTGLRDRQGWR
jgi:pSer/pThr/pTyr-binding forkhead associated (FHA) protein